MAAERRLRKELKNFMDHPPTNMEIDEQVISNDILTWHVRINGVKGTLYEGEHFLLQMKFNGKYPFDCPQVMFIGNSIPIHPHVYSNGHICLSILSDDWSPALSVESICLSILSMLSSCKNKQPPIDDKVYTSSSANDPKKTNWYFHDDSI
ncbi:hypothetical protein GJ496_009295 [Pomphorhynchus laevis]|nr:hypothetical protein GJ496_009295 [Pomphorhynchus laevis]